MTEAETPPSWLNEEFLGYVLNGSTDCQSECDVLSFEILPGLSPGDNFCSVVYITKVLYKRRGVDQNIHEQTFFIKTPLENGLLIDMVKEGKFIEKEFLMYDKCLPMMESLVGKLDIVSKHYPSQQKYTLVLENLSDEGYKMHDKIKQFDFDHSAIIMKSLATFHASSVALYKKNPTLVETVGESLLYSEKSTGSCSFVRQKLKNFSNFVENWEGYERFGDLSRQFKESFWDRTVSVYTRRQNMNVLNHGDAWTNNMLFKYDIDGKVEKIKLIDFQMAVYASIGIDLQYITWTSIQPSVRENRLTELHSIYLETLNSCLEKNGCEERMTREQFEEEINFTLFYAFHTMFCAFNIMLFGMGDDDHSDKNDMNVCDKNKIVKAKNCYRANTEQGLIYLEKKGFFNNTK